MAVHMLLLDINFIWSFSGLHVEACNIYLYLVPLRAIKYAMPLLIDLKYRQSNPIETVSRSN